MNKSELPTATLDPDKQAIEGAAVKDFSPGVSEVVAELANVTGLQLGSAWQVLLVTMGTVVGNAVKMLTPIFPGPLNLALQGVVCEDGQGRMVRAIDFLIQVLRDFQDRQFTTLGGRGLEIVEKEIAKLEAEYAKASSLEAADESTTEAYVTRIARLRRSVRPFLWVEDLQPGHLARCLRSSFDGAMGVLYQDASLGLLLDLAATEGASDWRLLRNGFTGRSYHACG
jgi:hypothetical protein